jgi:hypothetical protein
MASKLDDSQAWCSDEDGEPECSSSQEDVHTSDDDFIASEDEPASSDSEHSSCSVPSPPLNPRLRGGIIERTERRIQKRLRSHKDRPVAYSRVLLSPPESGDASAPMQPVAKRPRLAVLSDDSDDDSDCASAFGCGVKHQVDLESRGIKSQLSQEAVCE